jgi:hypothetical protein
MLIEQLYPGEQDYIDHFNHILPAFKDKRYFCVDGKPLLMVTNLMDIPDLSLFVNTFRRLAKENGLKGLHLVATNVDPDWDLHKHDFDAVTLATHLDPAYYKYANFFAKLYRRIKESRYSPYKKIFKKPNRVFNHKNLIQNYKEKINPKNLYYPTVIPNWDNSPRSGMDGFILCGSTPELFKKALMGAKKEIEEYDDEHKIIFIKSWNEWAEGNHLEPDLKYGHAYLQVVKEVLEDGKDS